jgi:hypothetical protein
MVFPDGLSKFKFTTQMKTVARFLKLTQQSTSQTQNVKMQSEEDQNYSMLGISMECLPTLFTNPVIKKTNF